MKMTAQIDAAGRKCLMSKTIDISGVIEERSLGWGQWRLMLLCLLIVCFDGFDAQIMGYTAPALVEDMHISRQILGPVISSGLFGLMLGALVLGTLGDRIGRRRVILLSAIILGVFSTLTAFAQSVPQIAVLRFLTGIGLGGAMPGAIALVSEYMPKRRRGMMVALTVCGFAIGPAIGGFVAGGLIHAYGWRAMFLAGGVIPLLLVPVLAALLPQSARDLIRRGAPAPAIAKALEKVFLGAHFPRDATYDHEEKRLPNTAIGEIFKDNRAAGTLLLWLAIFLNLVGINLQTNWLPLIITDLGFPMQQAITATAMFHVGGALGGLVLARLFNRFDLVRATATIGVVAGLAVIMIGFGGTTLLALRITIFFAGLFVVGGQSALNALSGLYYPNHIRSTGSGWALGIGRLGAAIGPTVGSALALLHFDMRTLLYIEAAPFFLVGLAIFAIRLTGQPSVYDAKPASKELPQVAASAATGS
jgi:AAHS family 4-hydroxybenzoate transporter-like MFS transporter